MCDQGCHSKRERGEGHPRRKKHSDGQPYPTSTSTQAINPMIPPEHNVTSQLLNEPGPWEGYDALMDWEYNNTDEVASINSYPTSYLNADTKSDLATGSYVMVQDQSSDAYSSGSGSNQTSEQASEQGRSAYYSPPRIPAAELAADTEAMHRDNLALSPHEPQWILSDLGAQKPRYNAYEAHPDVNCSVIYEETPENHSLHVNYETSVTEPSSLASNPQDGPWNQTALRVPRYLPSYAAFGLSPEPETKVTPPSSSKSRTPHKKSSNCSVIPAPGSGSKEKPASPSWEHIVVEKGGLTRVVNEGNYDGGVQGSGGRRKGKLPKETKEKAARVRKVKACWTCWKLKVPCSEGEVCERCLTYCSRKSVQSPSADQLCSRAGFADFENTFFPDYLHSHLDKREIKTLIDEHSEGFVGDSIEVEVSTGSVFIPMKLEIHFFKPKHWWDSELLRQHHLTVETKEQKSELRFQYSAPVGLMALSISDLKKTLRDHVEQMVSNPQYPAQTTAGDASNVPLLILEEVRQYCATTQSSLVRSALMLHAIQHFMSSLVTFTPNSAAYVYQRSTDFNVPPEPYLSSRLLNRQLKFVMHRLHREIVCEVLEGLEKSMRSRTKDAWGPSFAAILVLCLSIEGLQTAADTFVVCDKIEKIREGLTSVYRREQSRAACENVEGYPYEKCTKLFHDIFKTRKEGNGGSRDGGLNPFRSVQCRLDTELDPLTDIMVRSIYGWACDSQDGSLQELSQRSALLSYGYEVDPKDIKINNTGRLAARFLVSFIGKDT
ncbi:hypothetical protein D0Z07_8857 [Hyphodiscus hymeniophilus]|uniref:Uncharacterized protein n=1 Tax=Hyphodiscus hymeniophilus TaxID=353542 RepID=A0A9P6VD79_9HELO|nr:hypothetical protein D0Z07_8857 [Hyphodiscus hymeniophilus]